MKAETEFCRKPILTNQYLEVGERDAGTDVSSAPGVVSSHKIGFAGVPTITESMTLVVMGTGINAGEYDIDRILPDGVGLRLIVEATKVL